MKHARRGYSLIEMLTVISCLAVVLTLTASLFDRMLRLDRVERNRVVVASSLERLGKALRADGHATTGPADRLDNKLILPLEGGRTVEYLVREADILRTIREAGKSKGFETFSRPKGTSARFEQSKDGDASMVALVIAPTAGKVSDSIYRDYRIEAETGRYGRRLMR